MQYWIGAHIRTARLKKGWTQTQLGRAIGRTQGHLSKLEGMLRDPGFHELLQILQLLEAKLPNIKGLRMRKGKRRPPGAA